VAQRRLCQLTTAISCQCVHLTRRCSSLLSRRNQAHQLMMIVSVMIHVGKVKLIGPPPKITLLDLSILPRAGTCIQQWMESRKCTRASTATNPGTIVSRLSQG
jgi:hypothetical protein